MKLNKLFEEESYYQKLEKLNQTQLIVHASYNTMYGSDRAYYFITDIPNTITDSQFQHLLDISIPPNLFNEDTIPVQFYKVPNPLSENGLSSNFRSDQTFIQEWKYFVNQWIAFITITPDNDFDI